MSPTRSGPDPRLQACLGVGPAGLISVSFRYSDTSKYSSSIGPNGSYSHTDERLKSVISDPFDFHHLTHTSPAQFQSLDQTRENDLVTEFSVIRASQRPEAVLKGIRADDIHFRNFSVDDLATYGTATTVDEPAPQSPPASPAASGSMSPSRHARRESRIHENFSRPVSKYPRSCPTTPPPQVVAEVPDETAEPAPRAIDEILGLNLEQSYSDEYDETAQYTHLQFTPEPADDTRLRTPSTSSHYDPEHVPEEEEATRYWDSPDASIGCAHSRSISQASQPAVKSRSSSLAGSKAPLSIYVAEELSRKFSEALGSPTLPQNLPNSSPQAHIEVTPPSVSGAHQFSFEDEMYDSWDADIDYCYEHAAESTSNFDWSRTPLEETQYQQIGVACSDDPWPGAPKPQHLQPSPLSTSVLPTPELDPSPARSSVIDSAATPSAAEYDREFMTGRGRDYFQAVSPLGKQINQETLYEEYLTADAESDRHFPFPQGMIVQSENNLGSPRSSFSPISKCNSQESLMLSRAASIARKHRSSVSTTSVPELIHSLSSSRELMPTDRMTAGEALTAGSGSAVSSHHRQTKSLAETHLLLHTGSSSNLSTADAHPSAIFHDRAKSASDVDARAVKAEEIRPPVPHKNPNRKKSRAPSYSLFPAAAH